MRGLNFLLFGLLLLLHYHLWLGEKNWFTLSSLQAEAAAAELKTEELEKRNRILQAEIDDLTNGTEAMVENARTELDYIREDEYFIRVLPADTTLQPPDGNP